jgi:hypothetical protein
MSPYWMLERKTFFPLSLISNIRYFLFSFNAALAVVPLPAKGSRMMSPELEYRLIILSNNLTGFWVG